VQFKTIKHQRLACGRPTSQNPAQRHRLKALDMALGWYTKCENSKPYLPTHSHPKASPLTMLLS